MGRTKQRETYGNGSVTPIMVDKKDASNSIVLARDGSAMKVQATDKHGNAGWLVCVSLGMETYTDKSGNIRKRQRKVQQRVYGTVADARAVARQLTTQYEDINPDSRKLTFSDACRAWETATRSTGKASANVMADYVRNLGHMERHIGNMQLLSITVQDIESALAAVKVERNIGNTTLHRIHALTKRVFKYAVKHNMLIKNPAEDVEAPKVDEVVNRRALSADECATLRARLDEAEAEAYRGYAEKESRQFEHGNTFGRSCLRGTSELSCIVAIRIELATGMRRSEVLGLTWSAVDFSKKQITVRQKLVTTERKGRPEDEALVIGKPKTKKGTRSINVDSETIAHLARWKEFQAGIMGRIMPDGMALTQTPETPVCIGDNGSWLRPSSVSRWWGESNARGFRDRAGFPGLRMHELRHTQATLLLGNGVDLKTVQTRMGHAKSSHTLDMYAHAIPANDVAAANVIDAIINAPAKASATVLELSKTA